MSDVVQKLLVGKLNGFILVAGIASTIYISKSKLFIRRDKRHLHILGKEYVICSLRPHVTDIADFVVEALP